MRASKGDRLIIKAHRIGEPERDAEILEVRRGDGGPPYRIRWSDDGRETLLFPGPDAVIQHLGHGKDAETGKAREQVRDAASADVMLGCDMIAVRPRRPFNGLEGVEQVTLWKKGRNVTGLLWLAPGAQIPAHCHELAAHHVWVAEGTAVVEGHKLDAGSYWHIPPGCSHAVEPAPGAGRTLFSLYLQSERHAALGCAAA